MRKCNLVLSIAALLSLSACTPLVLFGGSAGAGATLSKQKTVGSSVDDVNIWSKIKADFLKNHKEIPGILTNVSVEVSEGRVLLTGTVDSADNRLKILKIVWDQAGVHEVINEIKLSEDSSSSVKQYTNDTWITTQVKSKMLASKLVRSINYNIETIDGIVYILGIARNDEELHEVVDLAETVKGVNKVVAYIRVSDRKNESIAEGEEPSSNLKEKEKTHEHKNTDKVEYIDSEANEEIIELGDDS